MKNLVLLLMLSVSTISSYAQDKTQPQTKEYATVYLKVYYQTRLIEYDKKGWSKSPLISMPDGRVAFLYDITDKENPKEISSVNDAINYMASFGWEVKNTIVLPYSGGTGNSTSVDLINLNVYLQEIIFERVFIEK